MAKKLYVGNLTYNVSESDLEALFSQFGTVQSAQIIVDRDTNRSKGFGFVEMDTDAQAQAAIAGLNEREHDGRRLTVNEAKPREPRSGGGGGYGGGGGGGSRGGVAVAAAVTGAAAAATAIDRLLGHGHRRGPARRRPPRSRTERDRQKHRRKSRGRTALARPDTAVSFSRSPPSPDQSGAIAPLRVRRYLSCAGTRPGASDLPRNHIPEWISQ